MTNEPLLIFDRALYAGRMNRARLTGPDILMQSIAQELAERLTLIAREFQKTCVIAPDPQIISKIVKTSGKVRTIEIRDLPEDDNLDLEPQSFDAVFNVLDLHAVNDVPGQINQMRRALKPDGLFLACLFAGETLGELRQSWLAAEVELTSGASPRVAPMIGIQELGSLLQRAGFALPVVDLDRTIVRYPDAIELIHEIRRLGMSNNLIGRSRSPVSRRLLGVAASHYREHFADADSRVRATLEVAWLTAWSPHESQPRPLEPGSAEMRLADALKITTGRSSAE